MRTCSLPTTLQPHPFWVRSSLLTLSNINVKLHLIISVLPYHSLLTLSLSPPTDLDGRRGHGLGRVRFAGGVSRTPRPSLPHSKVLIGVKGEIVGEFPQHPAQGAACRTPQNTT